MKIVLVEDRMDRVARIVPDLLDSIEKIIIYQSEREFEASTRPYRKEPFFQKLQRVDAWSIYETLDQLYEACNESGQYENVFLFDLCLEDEQVAFSEKLSVIYIQNKENSNEGGRCFIYTTFDRMLPQLRRNFHGYVVNTDLGQEGNFLLIRQNALLCEALSLNTGNKEG